MRENERHNEKEREKELKRECIRETVAKKGKEDKLGEKEKFLRSTATPLDVREGRSSRTFFICFLRSRSRYRFLVGFVRGKLLLKYNSANNFPVT